MGNIYDGPRVIGKFDSFTPGFNGLSTLTNVSLDNEYISIAHSCTKHPVSIIIDKVCKTGIIGNMAGFWMSDPMSMFTEALFIERKDDYEN